MLKSIVGCAVLATAAALVPAQAVAASAATPQVPTVVAVRAAHHPGYDRFVLQFAGGAPATVRTHWQSRITSPQTGRTIPLAGNAFLQLTMTMAQGHTDAGAVTMPRQITFALPNLTQLAVNEDFEAHLAIGFALQKRTAVHVHRYSNPSRIALDFTTPYKTVTVRTYFMNLPNYQVGKSPDLTGVRRPVIPPAVGRGALIRLFAGPTAAEKAAGLRFVASGATGFSKLTITNGVARVRLTGNCASHGATFTVANEIIPTLKQFSSVRWVKIYDQTGHTERPNGTGDSIPLCLEP